MNKKNNSPSCIEKLPGNYVIILRSKSIQKEIQVGKLGLIDIKPGYYLYVGSALGPGGVYSRISRHCKKIKKLHWHLDYLRPYLIPDYCWIKYQHKSCEQIWAKHLCQSKFVSIAKNGFGSTDSTVTSHLFYSKAKPNLKILQLKNERGKILELSLTDLVT